MGHIGMIASKLSENIKVLRAFDESIRYFRNNKEITKNDEIIKNVNNLLLIINPLSDVLKGNLSKSLILNENNVLKTIKNRFTKDWFNYKEKILNLKKKLDSPNFKLYESDFSILNDIGDAIDIECINLFNRMNE